MKKHRTKHNFINHAIAILVVLIAILIHSCKKDNTKIVPIKLEPATITTTGSITTKQPGKYQENATLAIPRIPVGMIISLLKLEKALKQHHWHNEK